jgi:hypothetical protein
MLEAREFPAYNVMATGIQAAMEGYISRDMQVVVPCIINKQTWRWETPCDEKVIVMAHKKSHHASRLLEKSSV